MDFMNMFDYSNKVDGYFDRLEKALRIKKLAKEVSEGALDKEMEAVIVELVKVTRLELQEAIKKHGAKEASTKGGENTHGKL